MNTYNNLKVILFTSIIIRILIWLLISPDRWASDEFGYYKMGIDFSNTKNLSNQWPPLTSIIITILNYISYENVKFFRLIWNLIDIINIYFIYSICKIIINNISSGEYPKLPLYSSIAYSLYLPAISFSQFLTSETPTLFLILLISLFT